MTRKPWLAIVVLLLIGLNTTIFVHAARTWRPDDEIAATFDDDCVAVVAPVVSVPGCVVLSVEPPPATSSVAVAASVIADAPKTSPPRSPVT